MPAGELHVQDPFCPHLGAHLGHGGTVERFTLRGEVEHAFEQDRIADFETSTDAYTLVNASVAFQAPSLSLSRRPRYTAATSSAAKSFVKTNVP